MHNIYKVGGHCFKVSGSILCSVLERMAGFAPFEVAVHKKQEYSQTFLP